VQSDTEKHGNTKYTKIVGKIEKKCRKGLDFKVYLNDTLIPEGNIREDFQDGKSKKSSPFRHDLCDRPDPAVLHRPDPGSWKNAPAMNGWKHTTIGRSSSRSIRLSRSRELKSGTGVKRRWNFRRNGFRSRSCILKNAAPEAGAASVLQCVMRCRKNPIQNLF